MPVHRKKRPWYPIQTPLTSLIDIVFMLLIYFLLTTSFMADEGIRIRLPQARSSAPVAPEEITVTVDREGRTYIKKVLVAEDRLFAELKAMIGLRTDAMVMVKADRLAAVNRAVKVMDLAKAAGADRLCLATEKE